MPRHVPRHAARESARTPSSTAVGSVQTAPSIASAPKMEVSDVASAAPTAPAAGKPQWPPAHAHASAALTGRSEEHTSELQSLMRISYAVFCLKKKKNETKTNN